MGFSSLLYLLVSIPLGASDVRIPAEDWTRNHEWLTQLGVKPPGSPLGLDQPWNPPYTKRSLVVPAHWLHRGAPETVDAELLRKDLVVLEQVMANTYSGWATAENLGWDWRKFFDQARSELAGKGTLPGKTAFGFWAKLMDFQLDNHSGPVPGYGMGFSSRTATLRSVPKGPCTRVRTASGAVVALNPRDAAQQPKQTLDVNLERIHYIAYPGREELQAVECAGEWIELELSWRAMAKDRIQDVLGLSQAAEDGPAFRRIDADIAYLRLPTFSKANNEKLMQLEKSIQARGEKILIVDLRRNGGGDNRLNAIENWVRVPRVNAWNRLSDSCLYPALRWGYAVTSSAGLKPPVSNSLRRSLEWSAGELFKKSPEGCPSKFVENQATWQYVSREPWAKPKGKTRILALVDNGCGSDCEYAVLLLSAIPGTVIAGQNTFGVVQFTQPGYFVLPNTRHVFRIALGNSDPYGDRRSFDGYGFDVDIFLNTREAQQANAFSNWPGD